MKKILCFVFLLIATRVLHGETEVKLRNLENRVKQLEQKQTQINPQFDPITPNAGPKVYDGMDMFLYAGFIYWTARLDGLSYALTGVGDFSNDPSKGNVHSVDWNWDPGFKAGYGWTFCHGGWDLYLQYTWFYTNVSSERRSQHIQPSFEIATPFTYSLIEAFFIDQAHAHWDLHYQLGDLELGRNYYINRFLKLRPFIGIKGAWQKQDYNVFFETAYIQNNVFNIKSDQDLMLWGIGMKAGLNTAWHFYKHFSVYGDFALTGMWTHHNINRKDVFSEIQSSNQQQQNNITVTNLQSTLRIIKPVLEFGIGFRLESYFHCNRMHIQLQSGWEAQIWPNQTLYINLSNYYDKFDLSLQGLTTKLRLDF